MILLPVITNERIDRICDLYKQWFLAEEEDADSIADEIDYLIAGVGFIEKLQISQALEKRGLPNLRIIQGHSLTVDRSARKALKESYDKKYLTDEGEEIPPAPRPITIVPDKKQPRKRKQKEAINTHHS